MRHRPQAGPHIAVRGRSPRQHCAGCRPVGSTRDRPRSLAKSGPDARLRIPTRGSPATHRFKEVHMLPLIFGKRPFSVSGRDPSDSEYGAVMPCRSMTRYPIRQRECRRIIEETHSE